MVNAEARLPRGWDQRPDAALLRAEDLLAAPARSFFRLSRYRADAVMVVSSVRSSHGFSLDELLQLADSDPPTARSPRELALAAGHSRPTGIAARQRCNDHCPTLSPPASFPRRPVLPPSSAGFTFRRERSTRRSPIAQRPDRRRRGRTNPACRRRPVCRRFLTASVSCRSTRQTPAAPQPDRCTSRDRGEFPTSADRLARRRLPCNPTERAIHIAGVGNSPPPVGQQCSAR